MNKNHGLLFLSLTLPAFNDKTDTTDKKVWYILVSSFGERSCKLLPIIILFSASFYLNSEIYHSFCHLVMYCFHLVLEKQHYVENRAWVFESNLDLNSRPEIFLLL